MASHSTPVFSKDATAITHLPVITNEINSNDLEKILNEEITSTLFTKISPLDGNKGNSSEGKLLCEIDTSLETGNVLQQDRHQLENDFLVKYDKMFWDFWSGYLIFKNLPSNSLMYGTKNKQ